MANIKSAPGKSASKEDLSEYIAYLRNQLQYEIDLREKQFKELKKAQEE